MAWRLHSPRSKGGWGWPEIVLVVGLFALLYRFAPLFVALGFSPEVIPPAMAQGTPIPSRLVKVVEFTDRQRLYRVDLESGSVSFTDSGNVQPIPPTPTPTPTPEPPPVPPAPVVVERAKWLTLIVAPYDPVQRAWVDDEAIRKKAATAGVTFRALNSTEEEVDILNLRPLVRASTVPCVVIQDRGGKVLVSRKVTTAADVVKAIDEANK